MSATPEPTASSTSNAGTTSPAACTAISMRPPESVRMRSATRSADMPGPGRRFGHEVTMRQRRRLRARHRGRGERAGEPDAPAPTSFRRVILAHGLLRAVRFTTTRENDAPARGPSRS